MHQAVNPKALRSYWDILHREMAMYLHRLLDDPDGFTKYIRMCVNPSALEESNRH
jgi:hypothetical protein